MSESGDENSPVKFVCNGRKPMAYAKETGRELVFFLFFEISLWGKNERKRKKKNVLKECCRC